MSHACAKVVHLPVSGSRVRRMRTTSARSTSCSCGHRRPRNFTQHPRRRRGLLPKRPPVSLRPSRHSTSKTPPCKTTLRNWCASKPVSSRKPGLASNKFTLINMRSTASLRRCHRNKPPKSSTCLKCCASGKTKYDRLRRTSVRIFLICLPPTLVCVVRPDWMAMALSLASLTAALHRIIRQYRTHVRPIDRNCATAPGLKCHCLAGGFAIVLTVWRTSKYSTHRKTGTAFAKPVLNLQKRTVTTS